MLLIEYTYVIKLYYTDYIYQKITFDLKNKHAICEPSI